MVTRKRLLLEALYTFEAAARHGSFASAGRELNVTPSAVSHQIKRLESHLGIALFDRSPGGIKVSAAGRQLAQPLGDIFGRLHALVGDFRHDLSTHLTVSVMSAFGTKWLAPRIAQFRQSYPDTRVRIVSSDTLADFNNEKVDVGIRFGTGNYKGLTSELLMEVEVFPVCSPDILTKKAGRETCEKLLHRVALLHDESSLRAPGLVDWETWLKESGHSDVSVNTTGLILENPQMSQEAAVAGHGLALGLSPLVEDDLQAGRLIAPCPYRARSRFSFWLVFHSDRAGQRKIVEFRRWIASEVAQMTRKTMN